LDDRLYTLLWVTRGGRWDAELLGAEDGVPDGWSQEGWLGELAAGLCYQLDRGPGCFVVLHGDG
jgi:hypothetical protein